MAAAAASYGSGRGGLSIAVIVCFLNEEEHLAEAIGSLQTQTRRPDVIVLADDGSTDGSAAIAEAFAQRLPEAQVFRRRSREPERDRLARASELQLFQAAAETLDARPDVVAKLDADIRFSPHTIETIESEFLGDPRLGIAGTYLAIESVDGPVRESCPPGHVRGATKFYRRDCLSEISPIPTILGWDTIDEMTARMRGWRTASFATPGGDSIHLRPTSTHDGYLRGARRIGECAWGYGAHPLHVALGALSRSAQPPLIVGGLNYFAGWGRAGLRRAPRCSPELRRFGRREQMQRAQSVFRGALTTWR